MTVPSRGDDPPNPPAPPDGGIIGDGQPPPSRGEPEAFPGAPPSAPSFDDEIRRDVRYEQGLAVKALLAIALVGLVLALRVVFFG